MLKQTVVASRALERLRGTAAQLPNPRVLVSSIVLREARVSSEVENIVTTNDELYRAAAGVRVSRPTASNYLQKLVEAGLMHEVRVGRDVYFVNDGMLSTLSQKRKTS